MNMYSEISDSYNQWAEQYDDQVNKTRDLEGLILRQMLDNIQFDEALELGCGTGKNTIWLVSRCKNMVAMDFSSAMLQKAKEKISASNIHFMEQDLNEPWQLQHRTFDLICSSLVLEHINDVKTFFGKLSMHLNEGGFYYMGELHPYKQFAGSKARFSVGDTEHILRCFNHSISEFLNAAMQQGLSLVKIEERADADNEDNFPRILAILFQK